MVKKIIFGFLLLWIVVFIAGIWFVGGQPAAYMWNVSVFITAPVAVIGLLILIILFIRAICKKKKLIWNIAFIAISILFMLPVTVLIGVSPVTYPTNAKQTESVDAVIPVKDAVFFGGKNYKSHAMWPSECYAYDILKKPYDIGSKKLTDYGIYGEDIKAPVSGTVIGLKNNEQDIEPGSDEFLSSLGNYIFIKIDNLDSYIILAHLKKNSILVKVDSHIEKGKVIGKVGNSGTTSEPHLHIQHQRNNPLTMSIPVCAEGLPITFEKISSRNLIER